MLQGEHSAILSTYIKLPLVIKILVLSILVSVLHRFYCIYDVMCDIIIANNCHISKLYKIKIKSNVLSITGHVFIATNIIYKVKI